MVPLFAVALASCNNDDDMGGAPQQLGVKVKVENPGSRAMITDTKFGEGEELGIFLTASDGAAYDGQTVGYSNVKYTSAGTGDAQTWTSATPVMLSASTGTAYAYWPWKDQQNTMTAIPLETASQTDYMFATPVEGLSNSSSDAIFTMNHALTAIRVSITNDSYSGLGKIASIGVQSGNLAAEGSMNIVTGEVTFTSGTENQATALAVEADAEVLDGQTYTAEHMFVPTKDNQKIVVTVSMDGKTYVNEASLSEAAKSGYVYTISLSAKNNDLGITKVVIDPWKEGETVSDDMKVQQ